jgi:RES domain-containing protein
MREVFLVSRHTALTSDVFRIARECSGRWHRAGQFACYAFEHPALALLEREVLANGQVRTPVNLFTAVLPTIREQPLDLSGTRAGQEEIVGARFFDETGRLQAIARSSVCPEAKIALLNPRHHAFAQIEWSRVRTGCR